MAKVYKVDKRIAKVWLDKLSNPGLRRKLAGLGAPAMQELFDGGMPVIHILELEGVWYMDVPYTLGRFMYETKEGAKADKAALLTIVAEAL